MRHRNRILLALVATVGLAGVAAEAQPRKVLVAVDTGWRTDYHPHRSCVAFYDVTDLGDPNYTMKDNILFFVWIGYENGYSANKEEVESMTINPINGTVYATTFDSGVGGTPDASANDTDGDWDLWRIDYQSILADFEDPNNARVPGTVYMPSVGPDGFPYEAYGERHPGDPNAPPSPPAWSYVYLSSGIEKIGELARNGDLTAGSNSGGGDFFETDIDFVNPATLVVLDDSDYPDGYYGGNGVQDGTKDHRIVALKRVSTDPNLATHTGGQVAAREGGYNMGTTESWETFDLGLVNMDGFENDPNDANDYDPNYPIGWIGIGHSEVIDMHYVTRSAEGGTFPNGPGGSETIEGTWVAENDTPAKTYDQVEFKRITGWDGGADDLVYRGGFAADDTANTNDNNGDVDWVKVDETGGIVYGESGYFEAPDPQYYGDEGYGPHEPKAFTRSVLDYEYDNSGDLFVWLDPCDLTMHGPIPDSDPNDDDTAVCDGRFIALDNGTNQVYYFDIDGSPEYQPDLYVYDFDLAGFIHKERDALGFPPYGVYPSGGEIYITKHGLEVLLRGDINQDGAVDGADVALLTDLIADPTAGGKYTAEVGKEMHDLTGDKDLTSADLDELNDLIGQTYTLTLTVKKGSLSDITFDPVPADPNAPVYPAGTVVTLTAEPNGSEGTPWDKWRIVDPNTGSKIDDANLSTTIVMNDNYEVQAVYECGSGANIFLPGFMGLAFMGWFVRRRR